MSSHHLNRPHNSSPPMKHLIEPTMIDPLEAGIYVIRSVHSNTNVNLVAEISGEPYACIWNTTGSSTQLWSVEPMEDGYFIRNLATDRYLSLPDCKLANYTSTLGTKRPVKWCIEKIGDYCVIRPHSKKDLKLDIKTDKSDGTRLILYQPHGGNTERWQFQKVDNDKPPSYSRQVYVGPVPAGAYWLGQPQDGSHPTSALETQPASALTVAARFPLKDEATASAHLIALGSDGLWPNQIWILEPGRHGYRLKNPATQSYLNYVNRKPLMEPIGHEGLLGSEWTLKKVGHDNKDTWTDWWISPSSDHELVLVIRKGHMFNEMCVKPLREYKQEWGKDWGYGRWRFEPVDESILDYD